jgi:hypothetical protein
LLSLPPGTTVVGVDRMGAMTSDSLCHPDSFYLYVEHPAFVDGSEITALWQRDYYATGGGEFNDPKLTQFNRFLGLDLDAAFGRTKKEPA